MTITETMLFRLVYFSALGHLVTARRAHSSSAKDEDDDLEIFTNRSSWYGHSVDRVSSLHWVVERK